MGYIANALEATKEFKEGGDEVKLIFDGAGTKWIGALADKQNQMNPLYEAVKDVIDGACHFFSGAYGVRNEMEKAGVAFLKDYEGYPSFEKY